MIWLFRPFSTYVTIQSAWGKERTVPQPQQTGKRRNINTKNLQFDNPINGGWENKWKKTGRGRSGRVLVISSFIYSSYFTGHRRGIHCLSSFVGTGWRSFHPRASHWTMIIIIIITVNGRILLQLRGGFHSSIRRGTQSLGCRFLPKILWKYEII